MWGKIFLELFTQQKLFELFITYIPQSFAVVFLFFTFLNIKIKIKSYCAISLGYAIVPYLVRPFVDGGVHTLISVFTLILIAVLWGKASIIKSILFVMITFCITMLSELLSLGIYYLYKVDLNLLNNDSFANSIAGISSIFIVLIVGLIVSYIKNNKRKVSIAEKVEFDRLLNNESIYER